MFLRNHGVVVLGKSIEDAFMLLCNVMDACETQVGLFLITSHVLYPDQESLFIGMSFIHHVFTSFLQRFMCHFK